MADDLDSGSDGSGVPKRRSAGESEADQTYFADERIVVPELGEVNL